MANMAHLVAASRIQRHPEPSLYENKGEESGRAQLQCNSKRACACTAALAIANMQQVASRVAMAMGGTPALQIAICKLRTV